MINRNFKTIEENFDKLGLHPDDPINYVYFWGPVRDDRDLSKAILSNHFKRDFVLEGKKFNCGEQAMMYLKAELFGDKYMMRAIMEESFPPKQKALGRRVNGFDNTVWNQNKEDIMYRIIKAKFSTPVERRLLIGGNWDNRPRVFVEASPFDSIWGVKLAESHNDIRHPSTWGGENLLGFIITNVRNGILEEING